MANKLDVSASKTVLVSFCDRKRPVTFTSGNKETSSLICAFKETFADVLGEESENTSPDVLLQVKDEDWEGEYVDILRDTVQDRAKALLASKHVSNEYGKLYRIDTPVRLAMVWKKHGF